MLNPIPIFKVCETYVGGGPDQGKSHLRYYLPPLNHKAMQTVPPLAESYPIKQVYKRLSHCLGDGIGSI
jgi:hypothetical protein